MKRTTLNFKFQPEKLSLHEAMGRKTIDFECKLKKNSFLFLKESKRTDNFMTKKKGFLIHT